MTTPSYYQRLIRGTPGMLPAMLRLALWLLTWPYRVTLAARNAWYDRQGTARELSVPVISVGNITTGGTGKTPTVIDITTRLIAMDKKPGIVARGYGAEPGLPNDEELLIRRHLADKYDVAYVADPNRYAAARFAIDNDRADCIVMDDGFQHRKLHRDLNIVLIDATCPFGHGHLLPRGLLREPLSSLRRADLVMLTRSDQVSTDDLERTEQRIRAVNGNTPIIHTTHRVTGLLHLDGTDADMPPQGARVALFAAIANPEAFVATAQSLGLEVVGRKWWPDHHRYTDEDIRALHENPDWPPHDFVLSTEKDAVKLNQLAKVTVPHLRIVRISIDFGPEHDKILQNALRRAVQKRTS